MTEFEHATDDKKRLELGQQLAVELAVVQYSVLCATNILKPFLWKDYKEIRKFFHLIFIWNKYENF